MFNLGQAVGMQVQSVYDDGEDVAYARLLLMRWPDGLPVCPRCGHDEAFPIATRRKFKCKACHHQYSVTSGTIFASRKMAFVDLLAAICVAANAKEGINMLEMSRRVGCQYRTAHALGHKLLEAYGSYAKLEDTAHA